MKRLGLVFLLTVLVGIFCLYGCQILGIEQITTVIPVSSVTPSALSSTVTNPSIPTPLPTGFGEQGMNLNCITPETLRAYRDDVLNIEFTYPDSWGRIETKFREGGYEGHAYDYDFNGKPTAETELLQAGGRSNDFSEGRGWTPTDFVVYGKTGIQGAPCDSSYLYPICQGVKTDVFWMIYFPKAEYFCDQIADEEVLGMTYNPTVRIEINLPDNPEINGFVFLSPFLSKQMRGQIQDELFPLLGLDTPSNRNCSQTNRETFDSQVDDFVEVIRSNQYDETTRDNLNELVCLAMSITFK